MKYLITGAAGFVGTGLTLRLLEKGEQVIAIDSLSRKGSELNLEEIKKKFSNLDFRQLELEEVPSLILTEKPDLIFHFAAQVAVTTSLENPLRDFEINGVATARIAIAAGKLGIPVIYTSTNKVFGDNVNKVPIKELETRYDFDNELQGKGISDSFPIDAKHHTPYGCSKLVGDIYVREFGGVVNRCSCMYGPNQHGIVDQGWISYLAARKIKGQPITIYGDGKQVRDILHIKDVVRLLELEAENIEKIRGEAFAVGGGYKNTISLLELCKKWNIDNPNFADWRPADQKVCYCDTSKAKELLGWEPEVNLNTGLDDLYTWTENQIKAKQSV